MKTRQVIGSMVVAVALALIGGCGPGAQGHNDHHGVPKAGGSERRTDTEPLTKRFQAIGTPEAVVWYSGTLGDSRVPGPSTYWIDAVITLDPAAEQQLRAIPAQAADTEPEVVDALVDALPGGPYLASDDLNGALSGDKWPVTAWLDDDEPVLVLTAIGYHS